MDLRSEINSCVEREFQVAVERRRLLHQNPELSFEEFETSAFIKGVLGTMDISYRSVANTGVLGWIDGTKSVSDDVIVLRADIDALPIYELNDAVYKSRQDGVMHACGHDFHTSNLLGVAAILLSLKHTFSGRVLLLFQPAEERIPGGAQEVLKSGVLDDYGDRIKAVLGLHVSPRLRVGEVGLCGGKFMASSDEFYVRIKGIGGHAAEPHRAVDPIAIGAQLLSSLQQIVSRHIDPSVPSVLTFGKFIGNGAVNVIPDEVVLEGTLRTMDEMWRDKAVEKIERMLLDLPKTFGAEVDLQIKRGYPFLFNNFDLTSQAKRYFGEILKEDQVKDVGIWMAAEDFAYYSHRFPSLFFLVGINNEGINPQHELHNAKFDLDEMAFLTSMKAMAYATIRFLIKEV